MTTLAINANTLYSALPVHRYRAASKRATSATCRSDSSSSSDDDSEEETPRNASGIRPKAPAEACTNYTKFDVLLGRGRAFQLYPGNRRFHALVNANADRYRHAPVQAGKWKITIEIVEAVLAKGRFLKPNKAHGWTVVSLDTARQKVAHALQYQNRRQSKKQVPKCCGNNNNKAVTVNADDGSDHDGSNHDELTVRYPNVNRTYFSAAPPATIVPCVSPVMSAVAAAARSTTEKYWHGMATIQAHKAPPAALEVASTTSELLELPSLGIQPIVRFAVEASRSTDGDCWKKLATNDANQSTISEPVGNTSKSDILSMDVDDEWDLSDYNFLSQANLGEAGHDESLNMDNLFDFFEQNMISLDDSSCTSEGALMSPPAPKAPQHQYRPAPLGKLLHVDAAKKCVELEPADAPTTTETTTPVFYPIELSESNDCSLVSLDLFDILENEYQNEQSSCRADVSYKLLGNVGHGR